MYCVACHITFQYHNTLEYFVTWVQQEQDSTRYISVCSS